MRVHMFFKLLTGDKQFAALRALERLGFVVDLHVHLQGLGS